MEAWKRTRFEGFGNFLNIYFLQGKCLFFFFFFSRMAIIWGYRPAKFPYLTERSMNANIWSATRFKLVIRAAAFSPARTLWRIFGTNGRRANVLSVVNSIRLVSNKKAWIIKRSSVKFSRNLCIFSNILGIDVTLIRIEYQILFYVQHRVEFVIRIHNLFSIKFQKLYYSW